MSRRTKKGYDKATSEMDKLGSFLEVPHEVRQMAKELFLSLAKEKFTLGRPVSAVAFACLLFMIKQDPSCKAVSFTQFEDAIPRYPGRMIFPCSSDIRRVYNLLAKKFGLPSQKCAIRPKIYVDSIAKKLGLKEMIIENALKLAEEVLVDKTYQGRSPITIAAGCVYVAIMRYRNLGGNTQTPREIRWSIAEKAQISEVSIINVLDLPFFKEKMKTVL